MNSQPLVSVAVMTYNSSKYVLETLDSIKDQTYQNIELIISDDASTDDTIAICNKWLDKYRSRFANVKVLVPPHNTGQSGNYNRAFRACTGEWIKEIDGDDLLLPNCLTDLMQFVGENPEAKYVFGKMCCFGKDYERNLMFEKIFDYSFFSLSIDEQLNRLTMSGNCIPSPCSFYKRQYILDLRYENDERIPNIEDWPKWIRLLKLGVRFYYMEKNIVNYRVGSGVSTESLKSPQYKSNDHLIMVYYQLPEWIKLGEDYANKRLIDYLNNQYKDFYYSKQDTLSILNSATYKIGRCVVSPIFWLREFRRRLMSRKT